MFNSLVALDRTIQIVSPLTDDRVWTILITFDKISVRFQKSVTIVKSMQGHMIE